MVRKTKNGIDPPIDAELDVEHILSFMFGKQSTHGLAGTLDDQQTWKRYCKKLTNHLGKYIEANVITDRDHQQRLQDMLSQLKQAVREPTGNREPLLVASLVQLCLLLLGDIPNHWD